VHRPVTNTELESLLAQASYARSHSAFARQINRAAAHRYGLVLKYDGASVYWWLRGRCPEQPAPELIAEALSGRLGRRVHVAELGFSRLADDGDADALTFPTTMSGAIEAAVALWRRIGKAAPEHAAPFVTTAAAEAGWRWHFDPDDASVIRDAGRRVETADVETLRACAEQFLELDRRHGGGHARAFLGDFLTRDVAPLLRGSYTDPVGRELFAAAAELTGMAAFMSYDIGDHGGAERAFIQALRLSKAAGDRIYGAHILANLATQAIFLNLPAEAVRLSRAAVKGAGRRPAPVAAARLYSTLANAHALAGDLRSFRSAIGRAQHALDRADGAGPMWARYFTPAHMAGTTMRSLLDLERPMEALEFQEQVLDLAPGNARTRALHTALTATAHAQAGQIDDAAHMGQQAVGMARRIRSQRVSARIRLLADVLTEHRRVSEVAEFLDQIRT
jgi:tetratricopeptide (TPR) repeat protein